MKNDYLLVSNNPKVKAEYGGEYKIDYCNCLDDVITTCRDYIHCGYILISHPLAGSVKPVQNPYKSVILAAGDGLDFKSLKVMENAISKVTQFKKNKRNVDYPEDIHKDYQEIDYTLISSGIQNLRGGEQWD